MTFVCVYVNKIVCSVSVSDGNGKYLTLAKEINERKTALDDYACCMLRVASIAIIVVSIISKRKIQLKISYTTHVSIAMEYVMCVYSLRPILAT